MSETTKSRPSFKEAVSYLRMRKKASPMRFEFIRNRVREELERAGFDFTDEEANEILTKVDQK